MNSLSYRCVSFFIRKGIPVDSCESTLLTGLHIAAENGQEDCVRLLITKGANLNAKDAEGATPLHLASYKGHSNICSLLVVGGADVNEVDLDGRSLPRLLEDLHVESSERGWTPLHGAAYYGHAGVCSLLIEKVAGNMFDVRKSF